MTTPKTPPEAQTGANPASGPGRAPTPDPKTRAAAAPTPGPDVLSGLPPMPKTKLKAEPMTKPKTKPGGDAVLPAEPSAGGPATVTKKELFTRVKARAHGVKGRDVRQVMDALLDEVGGALVAGEALKVPALGTLKVQRHKSIAGADVVICKLRRKKPAAKAKHPLAEPAEES